MEDCFQVDVLYSELIDAVGSKHPGESRHETALRYIREAEERTGSSLRSYDIKKPNGQLLVAGDLEPGQSFVVVYDDGQFHMLEIEGEGQWINY